MYWAHWDEVIAKKFVAALTGGRSDPPLAESYSGENSTTGYPWVRLSWFADLERTFGLTSPEAAIELVQGMMVLVHDVFELTSLLGVRLVRDAGLQTSLERSGSESNS